MIEQAMLFSLGFLVAALLALALAPAFWHRAIRLTTRRLEMQLPLSAREVLAGRDFLRAEFAVERRKLEQKIEMLTELHGQDMAELGRRAHELATKDTDLRSIGQRLREQIDECAALRRDLAESRAELGTTSVALHDVSGRCDRKDAELQDLRRQFAVIQALAANHRIAFTLLERDFIREKDMRALESLRVERLSEALSTLRIDNGTALARLKSTAAEIEDRDRALVAAGTREADWHREREGLIDAARVETERFQQETDRLRSEVMASKGALDAARVETERFQQETDRLRAEVIASKGALDAARINVETLERDLAALREKPLEQGSARGSSERDEIAELRKTISEIGEAVIRMADAGQSLAPDDASVREDSGGVAESMPSCLVVTKPRRDKSSTKR